MNFKNTYQFLINPFVRVAGWQALAIGLVFVALTAIVGSFSGTYFDGALDVHLYKRGNFGHSFLFFAIGIICITLFMWIGELIFSKNVRLIDVLGTMTLSKAPLLIVAFIGFMTKEEDVLAIAQNPFIVLEMPSFLYFSLAFIPFVIWSIALIDRKSVV